MKAINYRGQNEFYLFDNIEEPSNDEELPNYKMVLKENLSAGKKIINPEVLPIKTDEFGYKWVLIGNDVPCNHTILKPGDIFPLPDNIGFEEVYLCSNHNMECRHGCTVCSVGSTVAIRLFLKDEVKLSPVEGQDELWKNVEHYITPSGDLQIEELKSKFTITRKP